MAERRQVLQFYTFQITELFVLAYLYMSFCLGRVRDPQDIRSGSLLQYLRKSLHGRERADVLHTHPHLKWKFMNSEFKSGNKINILGMTLRLLLTEVIKRFMQPKISLSGFHKSTKIYHHHVDYM